MAMVTVTARRAALVTAAERRLPVNKPASAGILYKNHDEEHPRRQELRKMIDKGILERNPLEISLRGLETMKRIADNIVKHPDQDTYKKIRRNNQVFMRAVVEPKGALEFSVEMGFREKAHEFQTWLIFHKEYMHDLKLGLTLLGEAIEREKPKKEREERAIELAKAEEIAAKEQAMKHFMDDRKTVRERTLREAAVHARRRGSIPQPAPMTLSMAVQPFNGAGRALGGL